MMTIQPIYIITFDLNARGGISYYTNALIDGFREQDYQIEVVELTQKNRWSRLLALIKFLILVPKRAIILSSHVNFLRVMVPVKKIKKLFLTTVIYNTEILHPTITPILPQIDYFFPLFTSGRKRLKKLGVKSKRLSLITNIIRSSETQKNTISTIYPLIAISRLDAFDIKNKGFFYLLRALRYNENINLIIAGSGDAKTSLESYCKKYQIEKQVIFTGHLSNTEKIKLMRSAATFIHLSSGEGIPSISVIEAVEQGCSVIMHNDGQGDIECLPADMPVIETNRYNSALLAETLLLHSNKKTSKSHADFLRFQNIIKYYSACSVAKIIASKLEQK